jgi:hypothetical protein
MSFGPESFKRLGKDKRSSLFSFFVSDAEKKFDKI